MKTPYWSFLLMLLPSMAYTQNTEKENELRCLCKLDLVRSIGMVH